MFGKDEKEMKESRPLEKIQLKHLVIAFLILGVGCFLSLVVFLLEMIWGGKGTCSAAGKQLRKSELVLLTID